MNSQIKLNKQKKWINHIILALSYFLFPGYGMTMKNIEEATIAAKERSLHLNKIKEKKNC